MGLINRLNKMPPKAAVDPNEKKYIYMKVVGGEIAPAAALAPRCAPCGLAPKKVGEDIQKATKDWRGIKIYIEIMVQNRQATVSIVPTAAPLVLKLLPSLRKLDPAPWPLLSREPFLKFSEHASPSAAPSKVNPPRMSRSRSRKTKFRLSEE